MLANSRANNVIFVDTDNSTFAGPLAIKSIKYIGAASGTANIKETDDSGDILWVESGASNVYNPDLCIRVGAEGIYVNLTNSASLYLYLSDE